MPEELGNLLIRVTSVGFDEVLENLADLEAAVGRIGASTSLSRVSQQLDQISRYMKDMHGDLAQMTIAQEKNSQALAGGARASQDAAMKMSALDKVFKTVSVTAATFWTVVAVPRKFLDSMMQVDKFNLSITNMAINANMARSSLYQLGVAAEGLGGSRQGVAGLGSRIQSMTQGLRMGRGGGELLNVANEYGLDIRGSGPGGLGRPEEIMRNIAVLFERMGNSELAQAQKLDIKNRLGIDDGLFRKLNEGVKAFDAEIAKAKTHQKEMSSAVEASNRIARRKAELDAKWADAQLRMLEAAEPLIDWLIDGAEKVADLSKEYPKAALAVKYFAEVVGAAAALWAAKKTLDRIIGIGGSVAGGAAKGISGAGGGIAGGVAGGVGRTAGGAVGGLAMGAASGIVGAMSAGANLVSMAANMDTGVNSFEIVGGINRLIMISEFIRNELHGYIAVRTGMTDLSLLKTNVQELRRRYEQFNERPARIEKLEKEQQKREESVRNEGGRSPVSIQEIRIVVNSNASDAAKVAEEVRKELFRQINDSIDDAIRRGNLL